MKLKLLKLLSYGWTNTTYLGLLGSKEVVSKHFHFSPRTLLLSIVYGFFSLLRFKVPIMFPLMPKARMKNEVKANKLLKKLGIKVPRIISSNHYLIIEKLNAKNMLEFLEETKNLKLIKKIAYKKGMEVGLVHKNGHAFTDNKTTNTMVTSKLELYSIDHEFFCKKANEFQREMDLITLYSTLPSEILNEFWKSFSIGYKKVSKKLPEIERKDILGISVVGFDFLRAIGFF